VVALRFARWAGLALWNPESNCGLQGGRSGILGVEHATVQEAAAVAASSVVQIWTVRHVLGCLHPSRVLVRRGCDSGRRFFPMNSWKRRGTSRGPGTPVLTFGGTKIVVANEHRIDGLPLIRRLEPSYRAGGTDARHMERGGSRSSPLFRGSKPLGTAEHFNLIVQLAVDIEPEAGKQPRSSDRR